MSAILMKPTLTSESAFSAQNAGEIRAAVRRFIGSRVTDPATADDLTQDVLMKVHQRVDQIRDPRRIMGWVIQIARNTITDFFRSTPKTEAFKDTHFSVDPDEQPKFDSEESQLRDDLSTYIRSVVQNLPPIYRDALVFTEYDGLTQVELAAQLGLSVSAAKSRVQRARAMVHETIDRCCHFSVDRYGTVVDYTPRKSDCACPPEQKRKST